MTRAAAGPPPVVETVVVARLPGGDLEYTLRRSSRARRLRVTIHPERGVVVSLPVAARRGWGRPEALVDPVLAEREDWIRGHLDRQEATRARLDDRPTIDDGRYPLKRILAASVLWLGGPSGLHWVLKQASQPGRLTKSQLSIYYDPKTDDDRADATTIRSFT